MRIHKKTHMIQASYRRYTKLYTKFNYKFYKGILDLFFTDINHLQLQFFIDNKEIKLKDLHLHNKFKCVFKEKSINIDSDAKKMMFTGYYNKFVARFVKKKEQKKGMLDANKLLTNFSEITENSFSISDSFSTENNKEFKNNVGSMKNTEKAPENMNKENLQNSEHIRNEHNKSEKTNKSPETTLEMYKPAKTYTELIHIIKSYDNFPIIHNDTTLQQNDFYSLFPNNWLNSNIINFYADLLKNKEILILNTCFYEVLKAKGIEGVFRINNKLNKKYKGILLPINVPTHWLLVYINLETKTINLFDSLGHYYYRLLRNINHWISTVTETDFSVYYMKDIQRQRDGHSCGVFVCYYMYCLVYKKDLYRVRFDPRLYRICLLHEVIAGKLMYIERLHKEGQMID